MKKLCIVGSAETYKFAPFGSDEFEFWTLNNMYLYVNPESFSRWFELHDMDVVHEDPTLSDGKTYLQTLQTFSMPIYTQKIESEIPTSIEYPINTIIKHFNRKYFKSTIDYMIALALYEGYKEIHLYGVQMAHSSEYGYQKPSCEYWLGRAEGMGVKIILPEGCDLLKGYFMYGYNKKRQSDFENKCSTKISELVNASAEHQRNYYWAMGAKEVWETILRDTKQEVEYE